MPYSASRNLPAESASKLGHVDVVASPHVQKLLDQFALPASASCAPVEWQLWSMAGERLEQIVCVDGSCQTIVDRQSPHRALSFVKTALLRLDDARLTDLDWKAPHPFALRDLLAASTHQHATVFPLQHVTIPGLSVYDAIRQIVFESLQDARLNGNLLETLKWLVYERWSGQAKALPAFPCPHCLIEQTALIDDREQGPCPQCGRTVFITDLLGLHHEMIEEAAPESLAAAYMTIHETLWLFTAIRQMWETDRRTLSRTLFLKDGPLQLRAQYARLVLPIRRFLQHAREQQVSIYLTGQEKTGTFVDHLEWLGPNAPAHHLFIPDHAYICEQIQHRPATGRPYGQRHNYGAKIFVALDSRSRLVLSIPVDVEMETFIQAPDRAQLVGLERILATLPAILSPRHANALVPIELANALASLAPYPAAPVLTRFIDDALHP